MSNHKREHSNLRKRGSFIAAPRIISAALLSVGLGAILPEQVHAFEVRTNQQIIETLQKSSEINIEDPLAVFGAVLKALPDKVTIYPTENYFYFYFIHNGLNYSGNIRFDPADQFDGRVHFAYFQEHAYWRRPEIPVYRKLGAENGVTVEQLAPLHYRIAHGGRAVEFELVDLSGVRPPQGMMLPEETYIGPVFDESAVRFHLVFNKPSKTFLYVLDEDAPKTDALKPSPFSPRVFVGERTSFAYLRDGKAPRSILIGVFAGNTQLNNMLDGPFDQLPDNFIEGETLREALLTMEPALKGEIDRYGSLPDGSERYAITTYLYYDAVEDLKPVLECAEKRASDADYYKCFRGEQDRPPPPPSPETAAAPDTADRPKN